MRKHERRPYAPPRLARCPVSLGSPLLLAVSADIEDGVWTTPVISGEIEDGVWTTPTISGGITEDGVWTTPTVEGYTQEDGVWRDGI